MNIYVRSNETQNLYRTVCEGDLSVTAGEFDAGQGPSAAMHEVLSRPTAAEWERFRTHVYSAWERRRDQDGTSTMRRLVEIAAGHSAGLHQGGPDNGILALIVESDGVRAQHSSRVLSFDELASMMA